jgi:hypothetical protein
MIKCSFLIYPGWPGVSTILRNIRDELSLFDKNIQVETLDYDGNVNFNLLKKLKNDPPDYFFVGGFDKNVKLLIQNVNRDKTRTILVWCSPLTQMELGGEISRFMEVTECADNGLIDYLALLIESDYAFLSKIKKYFIYLPAFLNGKELEESILKNKDFNKGILDCDIYCAPCARKNIFIQLYALSLLKDKVKTHVNYMPGPASNQYINVLDKIIGQDYYRNDLWMQRGMYLRKIQQMDFCSQVTLSESFNYTAAEHMYYSVPVLFSRCSPIAKEFGQDLKKLVIENYDDVGEIYSKMKELIKDNSFRIEMGRLSSEFINKFSSKNKDILMNNLNDIIR